MKNLDVINEFLNISPCQIKTAHVKIVIDWSGKIVNLYNYNTIIAKRPFEVEAEYFFINKTKYSVSTSRIQNLLKNRAKEKGLKFLEIPHNELYNKHSLLDFQFELKQAELFI